MLGFLDVSSHGSPSISSSHRIEVEERNYHHFFVPLKDFEQSSTVYIEVKYKCEWDMKREKESKKVVEMNLFPPFSFLLNYTPKLWQMEFIEFVS